MSQAANDLCQADQKFSATTIISRVPDSDRDSGFSLYLVTY